MTVLMNKKEMSKKNMKIRREVVRRMNANKKGDIEEKNGKRKRDEEEDNAESKDGKMRNTIKVKGVMRRRKRIKKKVIIRK